MFKITIRELLLLTLVVGLAVAWSLRERLLLIEVAAINAQANTLEYVLTQQQMTILWNQDRSILTVYREGEDNGRSLFVPAFKSPFEAYVRVTIRELVLFTVVAAMGVGWAIREQRLAAKVAATKAEANTLEYRALTRSEV